MEEKKIEVIENRSHRKENIFLLCCLVCEKEKKFVKLQFSKFKYIMLF